MLGQQFDSMKYRKRIVYFCKCNLKLEYCKLRFNNEAKQSLVNFRHFRKILGTRTLATFFQAIFISKPWRSFVTSECFSCVSWLNMLLHVAFLSKTWKTNVTLEFFSFMNWINMPFQAAFFCKTLMDKCHSWIFFFMNWFNMLFQTVF